VKKIAKNKKASQFSIKKKRKASHWLVLYVLNLFQELISNSTFLSQFLLR